MALKFFNLPSKISGIIPSAIRSSHRLICPSMSLREVLVLNQLIKNKVVPGLTLLPHQDHVHSIL